MMKQKEPKALVVAAHPDDEVLGCGATLAKLNSKNWECHAILLTGGVTGRAQSDQKPDTAAQKKLEMESEKAAAAIGLASVTRLNLPDNALDTVGLNDIALQIKEKIQLIRPTKVFLHHPGDYNWDHRIAFEAGMMAARPNYGDFIPTEIFCFETLSSTERSWQNPQFAFHPTVFVDVAQTIDRKKLAMQYYESEYRAYPHPRSIEGIEYLARKRGLEVGLTYAEAFSLVRSIQ